MDTYRMFTESVIPPRVVHHHFISEQGNEAELGALEKLLLAYDRFELDGRNHSRKFILSKTSMQRKNIEISDPKDGSTWTVLTGKLTSIPDPSDEDTALRTCKRLYDRGIETFIMKHAAKTPSWV